jgi:hypothetical protein
MRLTMEYHNIYIAIVNHPQKSPEMSGINYEIMGALLLLY